MNVQPNTERVAPQGNADAKADEILASFFAGEESDDADETSASSTDPETGSEDPTLEAEQAEGDATDVDPETAAPTDEASTESYTVQELAEHLDLDATALYAAQISMEDGTKIPISQMKDEWTQAKRQLADVGAKEAELGRVRQQLEQQARMVQQAQGQQQLQADPEEQKLYAKWAALAEAENDQAYWQQLGAQDAGKAALTLQQLQGQKRALEQQLQAKATERQAKGQQQQQQWALQAQAEIAKRIPEWSKDQTVMQREWGEISDLWSRFGMPQDQVNALWQSPPAMHASRVFVELLRKLNAADPAKKKVLKFPALKPGKRAGTPKKTPLDEIKAKANGAGRRDRDNLAAAALQQFMKG